MEPIAFQTEDGLRLEGEIRYPNGEPRGSAVSCHADPRRGGSKDYPLLWAIRIELSRRGFAVLSFNFRGVMGSEGGFGGGVAEVRDVRAAVGLIREKAPGPTLVVGWSFGAHVALRAGVADDRLAALALVGLPLDETSLDLPPLPPPERLREFDRPVLLLAGQADPFSPASALEALGRRLPHAEVRVVPGADHFFGKRERDAAAVVGDFASRLLE